MTTVTDDMTNISKISAAVFVGHGNPMNALADNSYTRGWRAIGQTLPRPRAILSISAHWYLPGAAVTINANPRTIHDFGGFPSELYDVQYNAPGDASLAARVREVLSPLPVAFDDRWGLDHGTWSVLCHMFPKADIPVVQLSIDSSKPASFHYDIGQRLGVLRDEGVLVLGSGNLVHNLRMMQWGGNAKPFDWALSFDQKARDLIVSGKTDALVRYETMGQDALLSAPTPDHYLPLLYVLGARRATDTVRFPVEGIDGGSISMRTVQFSQP